MSEYQVFAYFIGDDLLQRTFGSGDPRLLEQVLTDPHKLIETFGPRFSGKTLEEAIADLINGQEEEGRPFAYSFALWVIVDALATQRPRNPHIPYPFDDLYDFNELLGAQANYPRLQGLFLALNGEIENSFPVRLRNFAEIPTFSYTGADALAEMAEEIGQLRDAIRQEVAWTLDIEAPEDFQQLLGWLQEGIDRHQNILLVQEGDL